MAGGRPSKYIPEYAEQAKKLCELGATDADMSKFFKVSIATIWNWSCSHPEFLSAVKCSKDLADELVTRSLYQRARGGVVKSEREILDEDGRVVERFHEFYPPETMACIYWLNNRRADLWRVKHDVSVIGTIKHEHVNLEQLPDDELQRQYVEAAETSAPMQLQPPPKSH